MQQDMRINLNPIKKQLNDFFNFIAEQNIVSLAIGFVLGGAVKNIVNALVNDLINPLIGIFIGSTKELEKYVLKIGNIEIKWGDFLSQSINFLIIALIIFYTAKALDIKSIEKKAKIK